MPREIKTLVATLEEAYKGPAWHGPSLRAALKGIDAKQVTLTGHQASQKLLDAWKQTLNPGAMFFTLQADQEA